MLIVPEELNLQCNFISVNSNGPRRLVTYCAPSAGWARGRGSLRVGSAGPGSGAPLPCHSSEDSTVPAADGGADERARSESRGKPTASGPSTWAKPPKPPGGETESPSTGGSTRRGRLEGQTRFPTHLLSPTKPWWGASESQGAELQPWLLEETRSASVSRGLFLEPGRGSREMSGWRRSL